MAETILLFGIQKVWDSLVRESERFDGVHEQLNELKSNLNLLRSFLKDADAKKQASETVRNLVEEIKEIVFDTEDIIETFLLKEELKETSGIKQRIRRLSCIVVDRGEIASDMGGISKRISKVIHDMQSFGVQQMIVNGSEYSHPLQERQREMRKTFPSTNENYLVGLEENVKKLVGYLVEEDNIQVVSITGMGGIGKTTLARQVFNHEIVKTHFDGVAWVCISQQFKRKYVWETIFQKLNSEHDEGNDSCISEYNLQEKLFQLLETSCSLIVLDDIWNEEDWDMIKHVFPSKKGWKVLLTSRNEKVASHVDPTCVTFKLECLSFEESWSLFQRIAFSRNDTTEDKVDVEMEEMGKQMIKHCGGLPLAVKVFGGLLATRHTLSEWKRVFENIGSFIVGGTTFNARNISSVYHILYLSFEELPIHLKQCFLYLAHYPKDYPIYVEHLSYLWAAEGIPRPDNYETSSISDVADAYINELVTRNMVISERDMLTSRFQTYHLHDVVRDVCLHKAKEENFLHIVPSTSTANFESPRSSRRLAIHLPAETFNVEGQMNNSKLRSLLLMKKQLDRIRWMASSLFLTRLQLIRVLDLSYAKFEGEKLPSSIGKLIHLRYLSLFMAVVSHLPSSMRNLKKLLYLNLDVHAIKYMSNFLKEMRELAYLYLPRFIRSKVKMELGNLVNLETLENFSTKNSSVKDLHRMTRLEKLSINYNGGCTIETLSSSLSGLRHLESLTIRDENGFAPTNDENRFVLDFAYLKQLKLIIYMPSLPDEEHFPSRLTTIYLFNCRLKEDPMPILEMLLELKEVTLANQSFCGRGMVCSASGFPQLQKLYLSVLEDMEEFIIAEGSMPLLHTFTIHNCPKLTELPDGLRFITSLKKLRIFNPGKKDEWNERLSEGGDDYYKVQHIPSITSL